MCKKISGFVFDMDGLIFNTEKVGLRAWCEAAEKYGINDIDKIYVCMMGSGYPDIKKLFKDRYGEDFPFDNLRKEKMERYNEIINSEGLEFMDGAYEILEFLHNKQIPVALASSSLQNVVEVFLKKTNIFHFFDKILTGNNITKYKPDPEIYTKACKLLGTNPAETIAVEDSFNGIMSAHSAGMLPVMIPDLKKPTEEIKKLLYKKFDSLVYLKKYLEIVLE